MLEKRKENKSAWRTAGDRAGAVLRFRAMEAKVKALRANAEELGIPLKQYAPEEVALLERLRIQAKAEVHSQPRKKVRLGEAPEEYRRLVVAFEEAFVGPNAIRIRMLRQRRFGRELLTWLLKQYPNGLPFPEQLRKGTPDQRKFYNDLKYAKLLGMLNKFKGLDGRDPVELYYELCARLGGVITRGKLTLLVQEGGKAIHHALSRLPNPDVSGQTLLQKHVPVGRVARNKRSAE